MLFNRSGAKGSKSLHSHTRLLILLPAAAVISAALYFTTSNSGQQLESGSIKAVTAAAIRIVPGMEEPLIATGAVTKQENSDLKAALATFHEQPSKVGNNSDYDDYAKPLIAYINSHPNSAWNAALNLNIGLGYYRAGYFSRTFTYFE